jgi:hypothetical protein
MYVPRWGIKAPQARVWLSEALKSASYLALDPPAHFGFFGSFPGFVRFLIEFEDFCCL